MASEGGVQLDSAGGPRWWIPAGFRSPAGIHLRGPARSLILRRIQAIRGGFRPGWTPKKIALTLAKSRASPPRIRFTPIRTRKIRGLDAEAHPVSQLVPLANETDRSTPSSHDHPSASHSPCDLGAKLHSPQKKGIPSGVSPKIVSLARKGLTGEKPTAASHTRHQDMDRAGDPIPLICNITDLAQAATAHRRDQSGSHHQAPTVMNDFRVQMLDSRVIRKKRDNDHARIWWQKVALDDHHENDVVFCNGISAQAFQVAAPGATMISASG